MRARGSISEESEKKATSLSSFDFVFDRRDKDGFKTFYAIMEKDYNEVYGPIFKKIPPNGESLFSEDVVRDASTTPDAKKS